MSWPLHARDRGKEQPLHNRHFIELTQPEIAAQFRKNPLVIMPAGSVEQHGPHLPTGTDIFASIAIAQGAATDLYNDWMPRHSYLQIVELNSR